MDRRWTGPVSGWKAGWMGECSSLAFLAPVISPCSLTPSPPRPQTHTHTYLSRTALLLLLPILLHHLPAHSALSPLPPFIEIYPHSRPAFPYQSSDFNLANLNTARQTPQRSSSASAPGILRPESTPLSSSSYPAQGPSTPGPSATNSIPNSIPNSAPNHNPNIPVSPFSTLNSTLSSLSTTLGTLRVLEWTRLAGMRHGEVREKVGISIFIILFYSCLGVFLSFPIPY